MGKKEKRRGREWENVWGRRVGEWKGMGKRGKDNVEGKGCKGKRGQCRSGRQRGASATGPQPALGHALANAASVPTHHTPAVVLAAPALVHAAPALVICSLLLTMWCCVAADLVALGGKRGWTRRVNDGTNLEGMPPCLPLSRVGLAAAAATDVVGSPREQAAAACPRTCTYLNLKWLAVVCVEKNASSIPSAFAGFLLCMR